MMWSALCVTLAEILEVRGSNLTEDEAWVLLYAIGRQLKNVPEEISQNFVIVHNNVQLHRNGGLSIKFVSRHHNAYPELLQLGDSVGNALIYSLGMSLLICLQSGLPQGQFLSISDDLQNIISVMISPKCAHSKFEEITNHKRFQSGDWEFHVTECFKELYRSIFGSAADMQLCQDFRDVQFEDSTPKPSTVEKSVQVSRNDCYRPYSEPFIQTEGDEKGRVCDDSLTTGYVEGVDLQQSASPLTTSHTPTVARKIDEKHTTLEYHSDGMQNIKKTSVLFSSEPPLQLNLCQMASAFKNSSHVTVEYLNERKLRITLDIRKMTCRHVLGVSVYHLVAPFDPASFSLAMLKDGEYILLKPDAVMKDIMNVHFKDEEPHLYLRLTFVPDDLNSVLDDHLMNAIYMQTRRDLLDGFISCSTEEALLLAAYSLQYELGDVEETAAFRLRDYIPPHVISRHGTKYLRVSLQCLHARLKTMTMTCGRTMYMRKAIELSDYGSHSTIVFLTKKIHRGSSGRLLIGPRGIKVLQVQGENQSLVHIFSWDTLEKVSFKSTAVSIITKDRVKVKLYVRLEKRSKYIVILLGKAHRFYRFRDFQSTDQFSHPTPPTTFNIEPPSLVAKDTIPHSEIKPDPNLSSRLSSVQTSSRDEEAIRTTSTQYEHMTHPEISPYEPSYSHLPVIEVTGIPPEEHSNSAIGTSEMKDLSQSSDATTSNRAVISSVHVDNKQNNFISKDLPPTITHDDLTDVSSDLSEEDVDLPSYQISEASALDRLVPVSVESKVQDDVYAHAHKQRDTNLAPTSKLTVPDVYARHERGYHKSPKDTDFAVQHGPSKSKGMMRRADILQHASGITNGIHFHPSNIETGSRGEGDGISNFSGPDQSDHLRARTASRGEVGGNDAIPEDVSNTIADFEEFKRSLTGKRSAQNTQRK